MTAERNNPLRNRRDGTIPLRKASRAICITSANANVSDNAPSCIDGAFVLGTASMMAYGEVTGIVSPDACYSGDCAHVAAGLSDGPHFRTCSVRVSSPRVHAYR